MNVVFLSPHFPPNHSLYCIQLARLGGSVFGIADTPWENLRPELQRALTGYYAVGNLHDTKALYKALQEIQAAYGPIARVEAHNEYWMESLADLRSHFGIPGIQSEDIATYKRKSHMKAVFAKAGISVAKGGVARSFEEARELIEPFGYPVVAKPDIGVGAAATYKLHDTEELKSFFSLKQPGDYIFEEFIQGSIQTFDGLVDHEGKLVFCSSLVYSDGIMEVVNDDRHVYYYTLRDIPQDLQEVGERTLEAFEARETFFHFEFFRTRDDRLIALEINMRPPGGPTIDMWNYASDIDLYRQWARVVVGEDAPFSYDRKFFCCYVSRKQRFDYKHSHEEILERYGDCMVLHHHVERAFSRAMGDYAYILRSPEHSLILQAAQFIQAERGQEEE